MIVAKYKIHVSKMILNNNIASITFKSVFMLVLGSFFAKESPVSNTKTKRFLKKCVWSKDLLS